jgi:DNA-binding MarR family transcriptional regulator
MADESIADLMRVAAAIRRVTRRQVAGSLGVAPLPEAQRELLLVVERAEGIGVAAAATELGLASNSVSTLVNILAEAGLLLREADPADRRAARLHLTPAARTRLANWRAARTDLLEAALDRAAPGDRAAIAAAVPVMRRVLAELKAGVRA